MILMKLIAGLLVHITLSSAKDDIIPANKAITIAQNEIDDPDAMYRRYKLPEYASPFFFKGYLIGSER